MCILSQKIGDFVNAVKTVRLQGSATVAEALAMMDALKTDVIGVECDNDFVGVFTRKDYRKTVVRQNLDPAETTLYEVMAIDPPSVEEDTALRDVYNAMLARRWEFMPVVKGKCLQAIVSLQELGEHIMQAYEKSDAEYRMVMNYFKNGESYAFADYDW